MIHPSVINTSISVQHQHADGAWHPMELEAEPATPSQHDPERGWLEGQVYSCTNCSERIRIVTPGDGPAAENT